MPRRAREILVETVGPRPDPVAAAEAILPLFLAFVDGRGSRPTLAQADASARMQNDRKDGANPV